MESLETVNTRLKDYYGSVDGMPRYRLSWSEDQYEERYGTFNDFTPEGLYLRTVTEVRRVQKYAEYIREKYLLERLTVVPIINQEELLNKVSYEPVWVFEDNKGNPLPALKIVPPFGAMKFVIEQLEENMRTAGFYTKYKDPDAKPDEAKENRENRIKKLEQELFGDESAVTDALHYQYGVVNPGVPNAN